MQQRLYCTGIIYQLKQDRMCNCNTVARDAITIAPGQGCAPTPSTPYQRHVKTTYARFGNQQTKGMVCVASSARNALKTLLSALKRKNG